MNHIRGRFPLTLGLLTLTSTAMVTACGGGGGGSDDLVGGLVVFSSRTAEFASAADTPVTVDDNWFVYLADEAESGGVDLNGDGDTTDQVATAFELSSRTANSLRAAADVHLLGEEVFLVTLESEDGMDWSGDGPTDDLVLLHWSQATSTVAFVDVLRREKVEPVGDRIYYTAEANLSGFETTLRWVSENAPTATNIVLGDPSSVSTDPLLYGSDEGLVFLAMDEVQDSQDFNGDSDSADGFVLGLLDGTNAAAPLLGTGQALVDSSPPIRARNVGLSDWLVAFLVGEAEQDGQNLNDPVLFQGMTWQPAQCNGLEDADSLDAVLHYLEFAAWSANQGANPPVNTGLVGDRRVLALSDATSGRSFVGTISLEMDEGGCSLNGDMDQTDRVFRWVEVLAAGMFDVPGDLNDYLAIAEVPGGARGVVEVDDRIVAVISESDDDRDHDGDTSDDHDILAWLAPADIATDSWRFPMHQQNGTALGVDWLAKHPEGDGFLFTDIEEVFDAACNTGDSDMEDSFAVFGRFNPSDEDDLQWNGYCYAVDPFNAGLVVVGNNAFFRSDEVEQGRDLNEDGDMDDTVLLLHTVFPLGQLYYVGPLNDLVGPSVFRGEGKTVVYLADEVMAGRDLNGDGDELDLVPRYVETD